MSSSIGKKKCFDDEFGMVCFSICLLLIIEAERVDVEAQAQAAANN